MMPSKMSFALSREIILDFALIMKSADQISSKMAVFELNIYIRAPYTGLMFFLHFFIVSSLFIHLFIISLIHSFNYSFIHFSIFISHLTSLTSFSCYSIGFGLAQGVFPKFLKLFFQSCHVLRTCFFHLLPLSFSAYVLQLHERLPCFWAPIIPPFRNSPVWQVHLLNVFGGKFILTLWTWLFCRILEPLRYAHRVHYASALEHSKLAPS